LIDEWLTVKLPFAAFVPTFRGQRLPDATEIFPRQIRQRGFLIGDKPKGDFRLEIDWIRAYAKEKSKSSSSSANLRQPFEGREEILTRGKNKELMMFLSFNLIGIILSGKSGPAVGAKAPDFAALATTGTTIKLSDFNGSWVVLYFYPKSFTPGCTAESCSLRDSYTDIQEMDAVILGVSVDDIETQQEFKAKYKLQFDLVSDQDKDISRAFNVLGLAGMYAQRKTFIIDPEGKIAYIFDQVKAKEHDAQVKEILDKLQQT